MSAHAQGRAAHAKREVHFRQIHIDTAREYMEIATMNEERESTIMISEDARTIRCLIQATRVCLLVAVLDFGRLASLVRRRRWQHVLAAISTTCDRIERGWA